MTRVGRQQTQRKLRINYNTGDNMNQLNIKQDETLPKNIRDNRTQKL